MGQRRTTASFPPLFPVLLQSKLTFEKTFSGVVDPADVADLLEGDTTSFQLIQLVSPEAQILATMEERSRDFLFPPPRLISTKGAWREVLLKRSPSFPGISPRVEFTTTSIMEGSDGADAASPTSCPSPVRLSLAQTSRSSPACGKGPAFKAHQSLPENAKGRKRTEAAGYQQPTVASRARTPSPYTHRKMCQLSEDARQRLAHLQLGPHRFMKETKLQPPFLVPRCRNASVAGTPSSSSGLHNSRLPRFLSLSAGHTDASLLGSYRPRADRVDSAVVKVQQPPEALSARIRSPVGGSASARLAGWDGKRSSDASGLRDRLHKGPSNSEQIHIRVQKLLQTHKSTWNHSESFDPPDGPMAAKDGELTLRFNFKASLDSLYGGTASFFSKSGPTMLFFITCRREQRFFF
uniref:Spermatogenesis associated 6 n=1 Tax=Oryzias latipes TaxID=8090 RepID=A0A3B3H5X4_ORYLA